jgi:hypothetical protein
MKTSKNPQQLFEFCQKYSATSYSQIWNELCQNVVFYEHPIHGDIFPVIVAFPDHKVAFVSDFYDLDDMTSEESTEYRPFLWNEEMYLGFELESLNPQPVLDFSKMKVNEIRHFYTTPN